MVTFPTSTLKTAPTSKLDYINVNLNYDLEIDDACKNYVFCYKKQISQRVYGNDLKTISDEHLDQLENADTEK